MMAVFCKTMLIPAGRWKKYMTCVCECVRACVTGLWIVMLYFTNNHFIPLNYCFPFMYECIFVSNAFILILWVVCSHFLFFPRRPLQSESCPAGER